MDEFIITEEGLKPYEPPKPCKDLVVVVRCKNCEYYPNGEGSTKWLPCRDIITPPYWFCADGVKRKQ